jgi:filamentous hemagglutinin family protein
MLQGTALANPAGPQVISGQASFASAGATLSITNSPNTIINWNSFSINQGELTRFIQQSPASIVLNRVTGGNASAIYGALQSNGRVFLINQNGILFGPGAQVDVNGLIASTLDIRNDDFLAGKFRFFSGVKTAGIENQGRITSPSGGNIYLIAPDITNSGIITAPGATSCWRPAIRSAWWTAAAPTSPPW